MLNKVIADDSLAVLQNVWRGRILMVDTRFGDFFLNSIFFLIHINSSNFPLTSGFCLFSNFWTLRGETEVRSVN